MRECSSAAISKARNVFERALTAAGLHVAEGNKIWEGYREFEQALLCTIEEADTKVRVCCLYPICLYSLLSLFCSLCTRTYMSVGCFT